MIEQPPQPVGWEVAEERLSAQGLARGDPVGWFDQLYAEAEAGTTQTPWGRREPHPLLVDWHRHHHPATTTTRTVINSAVVVGCALGADAEYLAQLGYDTLGFDVSPTAVKLARQRHPNSRVRYEAADLLDLPPAWNRVFDLVVEIITVQALPPTLQSRAIEAVKRLVGEGGTLLVVAAVDDPGDPPGPTGPWPLDRAGIDAFRNTDATPVSAEIRTVPGDSAAERRWFAEYREPSMPPAKDTGHTPPPGRDQPRNR